MRIASLVIVLLVAAAGWGCKSGDKAKEPSLDMSSSSAVCKKAMECCKARVKSEKGALKAEDLNLMCSGVALAETDADCTQFAKGYAMSFTSRKVEVPAVCK